MKLIAAVIALLAIGSTTSFAQAPAPPQPHHEANFDSERKQADDLYTKNFRLQALPLYEDLSRQDPTIAVFAERLASGLVAAADIETDPAKSKALNDRAFVELHRAKALGDNSQLVEHMLGIEEERQRAAASAKTTPPPPVATKAPSAYVSQNPKVQALMREAETAFAKNDTDLAFAKYKEASELEPGFYLAKLYTGDACFRKGDYACAIEWFGKAVEVDPTIETAYRYWGDALFKSGHPAEAKVKYEEAIVANPYTRQSWSGLERWAQTTKTQMGSPAIQRPTIDVSASGGTKLGLPQGSGGDTGAWTTYSLCRVDAAHKRPADGRHTLAEEVHCLEMTADYAEKTDPTPGPGIKNVLILRKNNMLASWVLLNGADQQIILDYPAYRAAHRDLLLAYLNTYVAPDGVAATARPVLQLADPK